MTPDRVFSSLYGRQCSLALQALSEPDPYHRNAVYLATIGKSEAQDPTLRAINALHPKIREAWVVARKVGHDPSDLFEMATDVRATIEQEWNLKLPRWYLTTSPSPSG